MVHQQTIHLFVTYNTLRLVFSFCLDFDCIHTINNFDYDKIVYLFVFHQHISITTANPIVKYKILIYI